MIELCKANTKTLRGLATSEDLKELMRIYSEYFSPSDGDDDGQPAITSQEPFDVGLNALVEGDLGMDVEAKVDPQSLADDLGFKRRSLPYQFMPVRQIAGATEWDSPSFFQGVDLENLPSTLTPLTLHWHQLAGVHSIIRSTFSQSRDSINCAGVLVADDVGLGKTGMAITLIAFMNQSAFLQEEKKPLPPILRE
jgi:hypothetical protein